MAASNHPPGRDAAAPSPRERLRSMATAVRVLAIDAVERAKSGHPGMPMGMADVATVLFDEFLRIDPEAPDWPNRDRLVLSAGHGSMLLYALLHLTGHPDMPVKELKRFRALESRTPGHPEHGLTAGVETTTGPLGQGLANAVGMAIAERMMAARFGHRIFDHHTYAIAGDGCLMEGISQEAISLAGHLNLGRLIVLFDDNGITIDGKLSLADSTRQSARFQASGWNTATVDGHDFEAIRRAIRQARQSPGPSLVCCRTRIGFGSPSRENTAAAHGAPLGAEEAQATRDAYGWNLPPFEIPAEVRDFWRRTGERGGRARRDWEQRVRALPADSRKQLKRALRKSPPKTLAKAIASHKRELSRQAPMIATRKASELALEAVNECLPNSVGGSADLTGSNNTRTRGMETVTAEDFSGRYIHWGVREHAMAAAMNGIALHGGLIPYGGTFLCFADYAKPAIRLAALMGLRSIFVLTHDSIGLGEDGPTHQPVEHLAMLRAIPNLQVFRPADAVETAECWQTAIESTGCPSAIALSRQALPTLRSEHRQENLSAYGAYVLREESGPCEVVLIATGSEVALATEARAQLEAGGTPTRVVSMPCEERFASQPKRYRRKILPRGPVRVAVEAAVMRGWERWLCAEGGDARKAAFVGMNGFGASAPAPELFVHFDIRADAIVRKARKLLRKPSKIQEKN